MPISSNDVTVQTERLILKLRQLSDQSNSSQTALKNLETVLSTIGKLNVTSVGEITNALVAFNKNLSMLPGRAADIEQVQAALQKLLKTTTELNTQQLRKESQKALAGTNISIRDYEKVGAKKPGFLQTAEEKMGLYPQALEQQAQKERDAVKKLTAELRNSSKEWDKALAAKEEILAKQEEFNSLVATLPLKEALIAKQQVSGAFPPNLLRSTIEKSKILKSRQISEPPPFTGFYDRYKPKDISDFNVGLPSEGGTKKTYDPMEYIDYKKLQGLGLSTTAAKNLSRQLKELGITSAEVSTPITELSSGITTVTMSSEKAGEATKKYTAHIDNAGNILQDTQKRFRSFGSAVMRDTVEVLKWTMAISLIYTPIRKVSEMLEQARKIQLDLVDVQIALGSSTRDLGAVFQTTADIAKQTSSSIEGVIEGYSLAVAAAASAGSEFQRSATATALLKDSMVLAKLANVEQKEALDILVGAMSQLGLGLTQGTQLLDSWVAVSKKANVSINQLATSFAIVGSAAEEVGLGYNELNALVGTLAQSTTLSANEVGNAIRGIIAAMQTDKAQAAFAQYGIATKTLSGDFRDFMDILREMKILQQGGILDEKAMAALTQAGGAGARRGAQLSALVQNLGTAFELITVSEQANGEAAAAMGLEMETLDAATTRLNNSFSELAVTLGGEGGILSFLTGVTNAATGLVGIMRQLVSVMKGAAPVLATMMLLRGAAGTASGAKVLGAQIPGFLQQILTPGGVDLNSRIYTSAGPTGTMRGRGPVGGFAPLTNWLLGLLQGTRAGTNVTDNRPSTYGEMLGGVGTFLRKPILGGYLGKANLMSMIGPAAMMATNIGRPAEEAAPRAVLGGLGALPGLIAGSPVWSTVGSIIATGFYDEFMTFTDSIAESWNKWAIENRPGKPDTTEGGKPDFLAIYEKEIKGMLTIEEKMGINFQKWILNIGKALQPGKMGQFSNVGESEALLSIFLSGGKMIGGQNPIFSPEVMKKIADLYSQWLLEQAEMGLITSEAIPTTPIETLVVNQINALSSFAADASTEMMQEALDQISKGAPGAIQNYLNLQSIAQSYASVAGNLLVAQGMVSQTAAPGAMANVPQFTQETAVGFVSQLNADELNMVSTLLTQIVSAQNAYNTAVAEGRNVTPEEKKALDDLAASIENAKQEYINIIPAIQTAINMREVEKEMLSLVEIPEGITAEQRQQLLTGAENLWRQVFEASGIPKDVIDSYIANQKQQIISANGQIIPGAFTQIPQQFINQQAQNMNLPMTWQNPNIQDMSNQMSKSQLPQLLARYYQALNAFKTQFNYQPENEPVAFVFKDGFSQLDLDLKILNLVMGQLLEETKKQGLQGIYNLPEGATFMIPVTGFELDQATRAEMAQGGGGGWGYNPYAEYPTTPTEEWKYSLLGEKSTSPTVAPGPNEIAAMIAAKGQQALGATPGNPLPVTVTNFPNGLGEFNPAARVMSEYEIPYDRGYYPADRAAAEYGVGRGEDTGLSWLETLGTSIGTTLQKFTTSLEGFLDRMFPYQGTTEGEQKTQAPVTTALNLDMTSSIQLMVDGRTLATIIKPFLYQDLIRYMTSANPAVNRSIVG